MQGILSPIIQSSAAELEQHDKERKRGGIRLSPLIKEKETNLNLETPNPHPPNSPLVPENDQQLALSDSELSSPPSASSSRSASLQSLTPPTVPASWSGGGVAENGISSSTPNLHSSSSSAIPKSPSISSTPNILIGSDLGSGSGVGVGVGVGGGGGGVEHSSSLSTLSVVSAGSDSEVFFLFVFIDLLIY